MPSAKRGSGVSHKKRPQPDEAAPPAEPESTVPAMSDPLSGGRSKRVRPASNMIAESDDTISAASGAARRSSRGGSSTGPMPKASPAAAETAELDVATTAEPKGLEGETLTEVPPGLLEELAELDSRRAKIDAEVAFLRDGGNLLDFAHNLGADAGGTPAPAPALRGAAAASAAAKAARLAAQGIVAPPPGAGAVAMPTTASRTSSAVSRREAREASRDTLPSGPPSASAAGSGAGGGSAASSSHVGASVVPATTPIAPCPSGGWADSACAADQSLSAAGGRCTSGLSSGPVQPERTPSISMRTSRQGTQPSLTQPPQANAEEQGGAGTTSLDQATWNIRQWKKVQEPQRNKTHWDYLLQEMEWLSKDFREERQWKIALARKAVKAVTRWHQERETLEHRGAKSSEFQAKRLAGNISREVLDMWGQIGRVAAYKHEQRLDKVRQEARNKHLDFLVGQTARYTDMLTEGMTNPTGDTTVATDEDENDDDDQPKVEKVDRQAELEDLQREADAPIDASLLEVVNQSDEEDEDDEDSEDDEEGEEDRGSAEATAEDAATERAGQAPMLDSKVEVLEASATEKTMSAGGMVPAPVEAALEDSVEQSMAVEAGASGVTSSDKITSTLTMANSVMTGATERQVDGRVKIPHIIRGTLREYQHVALDWLVSMHEKNLNGILADEMGLGKTLMTISALAWLACEKGIWGPHLIVVPTSVMINWEMELKKFAPAFKILTYFGTQKERKLKRAGWSKTNAFHVCITSYKLIVQDAAAFRRKRWKYLVLDEAHHIKNFQSQRWQTLLNFNSKRRLLLTGTPLQNNLMELWSLLHFLMPHIFESHKEFKDWFSNPVNGMVEGSETVNHELIERLHHILRPFLLRRLKKDVEKSLPPKIEHVVPCPLSKRQRELYEDFMAAGDTRSTLSGGSLVGIMNVLMQLRKVCNHPDLFEERPICSPHEMHPLLMQTAGFVLHAMTTEPLGDEVHLDLLNLNLAAYCDLDSYDAVRTYALHTRSQYIIEVSAKKGDGASELASTSGPGTPGTAGAAMPLVPILSPLRCFVQAQQERRLAWRKGVRTHMAYINTKRCARTPLYSYGLRRSVSVTLAVAELHAISAEEVTPLEAPCAVRNLVKTYTQRFRSMEAPLVAFTTQIGRARAPPARLSTRHDPSEAAVNVVRTGLMRMASSERLDLLQPTRVRMSLSFPDKRLIQWDCGKLQVLNTLLRTLHSEGHRCLIFTQMTKMLNVLESWINICGYTYLRLDGSTKVDDRQRLMDRFNMNPKIFIFILATRAGGLGINLTGADTVIFYDSDWNPTIDAQAQDRAHRIGQTRQVHIYRLVSESTVEENILRKANQKRLLDSVVIQSGGFTTEYFKGTNAIKELFDEPGNQVDDSSDKPVADKAALEKPPDKDPSPPKPTKGRAVRSKGKGKAESAAPAAVSSSAPAAVSTSSTTAEVSRGDKMSAEEMELALLHAEDAEDREAFRREQAMQAAEFAEFDESVPYADDARHDPDGGATDTGAGTGAETDTERDGSKPGKRPPVTGSSMVPVLAASNPGDVDGEDLADGFGVGQASVVETLEAALTPVQRYMLRFLEETSPLATEAEERALTFSQEEWELSELQKRKEEEEAMADEDDDVLYYEVPNSALAKAKTAAVPAPLVVPGKGGRKRKGGASQPSPGTVGSGGVASDGALTACVSYLASSGPLGGLAFAEELQRLEIELWGPPMPPGRDTEELYDSAVVGGTSDEETGAVSKKDAGTVQTLEFSGLVTEGARGVQRVRDAISERKRQARDADLDGEERRQRREHQLARHQSENARQGSGVRASSRKSRPPARIGEDGGMSDDNDDEMTGAVGSEGLAAALGERRSHKKRRPGDYEDYAGAGGQRKLGGGPPPPLSQQNRGRQDKLPSGPRGPGSRKDEATRPMDAMWSPEEDAALLRTIHAFGSGNWELIGDVMTSLMPTRYRSARACYERCCHVLLPLDDAAREPGTLAAQINPPGIAPDAQGSLSSLPEYALCPTQAPSLAAALQQNAVGDAMRVQESIRANSLQASSLQTETSSQVKTFALFTRLVDAARKAEATRLPKQTGTVQHASHAVAEHKAQRDAAEAVAAANRSPAEAAAHAAATAAAAAAAAAAVAAPATAPAAVLPAAPADAAGDALAVAPPPDDEPSSPAPVSALAAAAADLAAAAAAPATQTSAANGAALAQDGASGTSAPPASAAALAAGKDSPTVKEDSTTPLVDSAVPAPAPALNVDVPAADAAPLPDPPSPRSMAKAAMSVHAAQVEPPSRWPGSRLLSGDPFMKPFTPARQPYPQAGKSQAGGRLQAAGGAQGGGNQQTAANKATKSPSGTRRPPPKGVPAGGTSGAASGMAVPTAAAGSKGASTSGGGACGGAGNAGGSTAGGGKQPAASRRKAPAAGPVAGGAPPSMAVPSQASPMVAPIGASAQLQQTQRLMAMTGAHPGMLAGMIPQQGGVSPRSLPPPQQQQAALAMAGALSPQCSATAAQAAAACAIMKQHMQPQMPQTAQAQLQQQHQAAQRQQQLQRVSSGAMTSVAQPMTSVAGTSGGQKVAGLPMSELIQVIREHPQLKSQIQAIVSRKDLEEAHKMQEIQRIVREAQPGAP